MTLYRIPVLMRAPQVGDVSIDELLTLACTPGRWGNTTALDDWEHDHYRFSAIEVEAPDDETALALVKARHPEVQW